MIFSATLVGCAPRRAAPQSTPARVVQGLPVSKLAIRTNLAFGARASIELVDKHTKASLGNFSLQVVARDTTTLVDAAPGTYFAEVRAGACLPWKGELHIGTSPTKQHVNLKYGDINQDGRIDRLDLALLDKYLNKPLNGLVTEAIKRAELTKPKSFPHDELKEAALMTESDWDQDGRLTNAERALLTANMGA
jgi:hypothetical protein